METALVSLQAWRGVPSHFNMETSLDAWVARALAAGGITLVVIIAVLDAPPPSVPTQRCLQACGLRSELASSPCSAQWPSEPR